MTSDDKMISQDTSIGMSSDLIITETRNNGTHDARISPSCRGAVMVTTGAQQIVGCSLPTSIKGKNIDKLDR